MFGANKWDEGVKKERKIVQKLHQAKNVEKEMNLGFCAHGIYVGEIILIMRQIVNPEKAFRETKTESACKNIIVK